MNPRSTNEGHGFCHLCHLSAPTVGYCIRERGYSTTASGNPLNPSDHPCPKPPLLVAVASPLPSAETSLLPLLATRCLLLPQEPLLPPPPVLVTGPQVHLVPPVFVLSTNTPVLSQRTHPGPFLLPANAQRHAERRSSCRHTGVCNNVPVREELKILQDPGETPAPDRGVQGRSPGLGVKGSFSEQRSWGERPIRR